MTARLIRDGILESEAINSVTVEAKWLYMVICLSADDLGLFEATEFKLSRKSDLKKESVLNCLNLLSDAGLIRLYEVENKTYGFIPKFRQRLQIKRAKHPQPHPSIYSDDEEAKNSFNKINGLNVNPPLDSSNQPFSTAIQPPEVEVEVEVEKNKNKEAADSGPPVKLLNVPPAFLVAEKTNPVLLQTYLAKCKAENQKPIPENDPVFQYTEKVGIPTEWVRLHWNIFKARHTEAGSKRQKSWSQTFRNSVQGNWYKVWYIQPDGTCVLSTVGKQAERAYAEAAA